MGPEHPSDRSFGTSFDALAVDALSSVPIPRSAKGFGGIADAATTARELVAGGTRVFDGTFTFPLLTIRESAVAHNVDQLARFCADSGVQLAPHAKTTMAPQLFARQLLAGAWGLTIATVGQAQLCREYGVRRLLLANELVDASAIGWVARALTADPGFELYCYVDSLDGVRLLDTALVAAGLGSSPDSRRLSVLVELGFAGGRTGCRRREDALLVAGEAAGTTTLAVRGVAGYEGGIGPDRSAATLDAVDSFCGRLVDLADELVAGGIVRGRVLVTAGGSAYPDVVARVLGRAADHADVLLRSGCYVTHDHGAYARLSPFVEAAGSPYALTAALELWTQVLSCPEPGLVLLGAGRRDVGFDQGYPAPLAHRTAEGVNRPLPVDGLGAMRVSALNDQHAYLAAPEDHALRVGDFVCLGISHPCTTIDRWRHIVQVDDTDLVTDVVLTWF